MNFWNSILHKLVTCTTHISCICMLSTQYLHISHHEHFPSLLQFQNLATTLLSDGASLPCPSLSSFWQLLCFSHPHTKVTVLGIPFDECTQTHPWYILEMDQKIWVLGAQVGYSGGLGSPWVQSMHNLPAYGSSYHIGLSRCRELPPSTFLSISSSP